jgi:hypothetical protein
MAGTTPGIDLADGRSNWRIDNHQGVLRFLKSGVSEVFVIDMQGNLASSGSGHFDTLGVGGTASPRRPLTADLFLDGSTFDADTPKADKVGSALTVTFKGGFGSEVALGQGNPGFLFGANDFIVSGSDEGDVAGIQDLIGRLSEVHQYTPQATLNTLTGLQAEAATEASASGSVTQQVKSLQVIGPRIRGGRVVDAYSAYLTAPSISGDGQIGGRNETLHVEGTTNLDGQLAIGAPTGPSATPGRGAPLPPTPEGYVTIIIDGAPRKVPYYN